MKRVILLILVPFHLFAADLIPQKIILKVSNDTTEVLIQKAILLEAKNRKDIYIFSDDDTELAGLGISEVNAKILLSLSEKLELIDITKENSNIIIESLKIGKSNLINDIEKTANDVVQILSEKYPPKEKSKLVVVETTKRKLSDYEKDKPTFRTGIYFNLCNYNIQEFYLIYTNDGQQIDIFNDIDADLSFSPLISFELERMWFLLNLSFSYSFSKYPIFTFNLSPAIGLFRNLLFAGPNISFLYGKNSSFMVSNVANEVYFSTPETSFSFLNIGFFLRFNITKNYYFDFSLSFLSLYREFHVQSTENSSRVYPLNENEGPPYLRMDFNFRTFERIIFSIGFEICSIGIRREGGIYPPPIEFTKDVVVSYLKRFEANISSVGLGVSYEF